jgi:hypothetical protein
MWSELSVARFLLPLDNTEASTSSAEDTDEKRHLMGLCVVPHFPRPISHGDANRQQECKPEAASEAQLLCNSSGQNIGESTVSHAILFPMPGREKHLHLN